MASEGFILAFFFSGLFALSLLYAFVYFRRMVHYPDLVYNKTSAFYANVVETCSVLRQKYYPLWLAPNALLQFICLAMRPTPAVAFDCQIFRCPDGGFIELQWTRAPTGSKYTPGSPICILLPGILGNHKDNYVRGLCLSLQMQGYRTVVYNRRGLLTHEEYRGLSAEAPHPYLWGDTVDLDRVVQHIAEHYTYEHLFAVGFSCGANMIAKYAGQTGSSCRLDAVVSVSNGFDVRAGIDLLEGTFQGKMLTKRIQTLIVKPNERLLRASFSEKVNLKKVKSAKGLREFDQHFTSKLHDIDDIDKFHDECSSKPYISNIRVPTVFLHARDDPLMPMHLLPMKELRESKYTLMVVTDKGGHVSWVRGASCVGQTLFDEICVEFFDSYIKNKKFMDEVQAHDRVQSRLRPLLTSYSTGDLHAAAESCRSGLEVPTSSAAVRSPSPLSDSVSMSEYSTSSRRERRRSLPNVDIAGTSTVRRSQESWRDDDAYSANGMELVETYEIDASGVESAHKAVVTNPANTSEVALDIHQVSRAERLGKLPAIVPVTDEDGAAISDVEIEINGPEIEEDDDANVYLDIEGMVIVDGSDSEADSDVAQTTETSSVSKGEAHEEDRVLQKAAAAAEVDGAEVSGNVRVSECLHYSFVKEKPAEVSKKQFESAIELVHGPRPTALERLHLQTVE